MQPKRATFGFVPPRGNLFSAAPPGERGLRPVRAGVDEVLCTISRDSRDHERLNPAFKRAAAETACQRLCRLLRCTPEARRTAGFDFAAHRRALTEGERRILR